MREPMIENLNLFEEEENVGDRSVWWVTHGEACRTEIACTMDTNAYKPSQNYSAMLVLDAPTTRGT